VLTRKSSRLFDVFGGEDFLGKVGLEDVLQTGYLGVIEEAPAGAYVGVDEPRVGRVLPPMAQLIAVGVEDRIESQGLDELLLRVASEWYAGLKPGAYIVSFRSLPKRGAACPRMCSA
jgi:hypothetical protein